MTVSQASEWEKIFQLLADPSVSEAESNAPDKFFIKKSGKRIHLKDIDTGSEEAYVRGIEHGLAPFVKSLNIFDPNGHLFEGRISVDMGTGTEIVGRCHIVLPPACNYPQVTIAKKTASLTTLESIASAGSMSTEMMHFLETCVANDITIAFSGGTGSGKDVHVDTMLPTPNGMVRAGDVQVGDELIDDSSQPARVRRVYKPLDPRHYRLTFSDGSQVKAGMGHVWKVVDKSAGSDNMIVKPLLTDMEIRLAREYIHNNVDGYLTAYEVARVLDLDRLSDDMHAEISGFGYKGKVLFSVETASIVDKLRKRDTDHSDVIDVLSSKESMTVHELLAVLGEEVSRDVVPHFKTMDTYFYNGREVLTHLLRRDRERRDVFDAVNNTQLLTKLKTTEELYFSMRDKGDKSVFAVEGITQPVAYPHRSFTVDPYMMGAWLGSGLRGRGVVDSSSAEFGDVFSRYYNVDVSSESRYWGSDVLRFQLGELGVVNSRELLDEYMYCSVDQRRELVSGFIDVAGYVDNGRVTIELSDRELADRLRQVVASLGMHPSVLDEHEGALSSCCHFSFVPYYVMSHLTETKARMTEIVSFVNERVDCCNEIVDIVLIDDNSNDYVCFEVDSPSHMFLAGEGFIPTHNTTMMEAVTKLFDPGLRIGVAEDTPELNLIQPNVSYLHSTPLQPGMDEKDVTTLSWVVSQFQRMRTDKLIIGEVRGKEFADFLVAANSGMEGSMITLHADDPVKCLTKMTGFALRGSERQPIRAINTDIANAVNIIVQLVIDKGRHRVSHIQEIIPVLGEGSEARITSATLYRWDRQQDKFYKEGTMSDNLRKRLENKDADISEFIKADPNRTRVPHHAGVSTPVDSRVAGEARHTIPRSSIRRGIPTIQGGR